MCFPLGLSSFQIENSLYLANFLSELHKSLHVKAPAAEFIQSGKVFLPMHFRRACCEGKWVLNRQAALHGKKIKFLRPHAFCMCDAFRVISTFMILARHWEGSGAKQGQEGMRKATKMEMNWKWLHFHTYFIPRAIAKRKRFTHLLFTKAFPAATLQVQWETNRLSHWVQLNFSDALSQGIF